MPNPVAEEPLRLVYSYCCWPQTTKFYGSSIGVSVEY